jgi:redox-sensitive bicupin YhaK (pirin superfamily)
MIVIHNIRGAADPLTDFDATRFVPLGDGHGNVHLTCLHMEEGGTITAPSIDHAAALLVVHGRISVTTTAPTIRIDIHAGMGCVFDAGERYALESATGAIVIIVEADPLAAHDRGISSPERIAGARWPSDGVTFGA